MTHMIEKVLLRPGCSISFTDRDDFLKKLDRLDQRIPARHEKRREVHRQHSCLCRYLRLMAGGDLMRVPFTLVVTPRNEDPPDFVIEWPNGQKETFELTTGSDEGYQKKLSAASGVEGRLVLPVDINMPQRDAAQLWATTLFAAFLEKARALIQGRFALDHLLIYDLTGLNLLLPAPVKAGGLLLRKKIREWHATERPAYQFGRISVLRDTALFLDIERAGQVLQRESPYFQLPVIRARNAVALRRQLRELDRFCRQNFIRHLKGSAVEGPNDGSRNDRPLILLAEFEPGFAPPDLASVEQPLSELTGFKVRLRESADLSRYFSHKFWRPTKSRG